MTKVRISVPCFRCFSAGSCDCDPNELRIEELEKELTRVQNEAVTMLAELEQEYNRKTNDLIERHAAQIALLKAQGTVAGVKRFEVIDHAVGGEGRVLTKYGVSVELSLQDDGETLKVFLK